MSTIGWKMYTIFCKLKIADPVVWAGLLSLFPVVFHFLEYAAMYFTLPETKGRTLEEIEDTFEAGNVVKASLQKQPVK